MTNLDDAPAGRLGNLFRTTAFKLSFAYLVVFATFALLALGYVAWNASRALDDQMVSTIEAEINGLSEQYKVGGLRRLISAVERRAGEPGASLYLVTNAAGERLVGNIDALPTGLIVDPGQTEANYARIGGARDVEHRAIMQIFVLPGGFRLLVGRDVAERDRLRAVIGRTFGSSVGLVVVLGVIGAWFIASRVLKRVDAMTETTRRIMAGDLDGRLAVAGTGDELDRLARNLNAMLERIGELMRGLRDVSDNIAHDLKTPLTRLRNRAEEALRTAETPDALRAAMEGVIEESDGLIRIFNALLMIARLEGVNAREDFQTFDVAAVVQAVAELYEPLASEQGLALHVETEGAPLTLRGSRELIGQALANLIDNAVKYGGASGEIRLSAARIGDTLRLGVADSGPGIPSEARGRVLDRFVRLEEARSRPGFGLGLSLVNAVVRLHQGTLALEDHAPGLAVVITLPAGDPTGG
ncbi:ATPase [Methylobacterium sp. Leaf465]|uniref:sensor histidine kinase n=1 Tax=unclassified Methylobacterium TaxID=2615210 RepID=UPI0006FD40DB|nr:MULTISPECIES: ATP-binding protein [unclassified Methylobacterium]KQO71119.1 ATPase [Methylobacterium sp. Leaf89]KQT70805.1 ATPase [Methylobacterium sp. Leaf465]